MQSQTACSARGTNFFVAVAAAIVVTAAAGAGAQTNNPFTSPIAQGALVRVGDVVNLPNSNNARARMNSFAVSPDGRSFVIDQRGPVYALTGGTPTPYFNLATAGLSLLNDNGERGFSTIAFHPQFTQTGTPGYGKLYAAFSTSNVTPTPDSSASATRTHDEVVYEFSTADPLSNTFTAAAGTTPREVLRVARPGTNHNGGQLGFNPNAAPGDTDYGLMYVSHGDSAGAGDPLDSGQNGGVLLGKILRIDPTGRSGPSGKYSIPSANFFATDAAGSSTRGEIYAAGFRNPQRFSWDRGGNKKMYVGDVGQGVVEEIDVVVNGGNYGWGDREGSFVFVNNGSVTNAPSPDNSGFINPIAEYDHRKQDGSLEGAAVSGGFVYRGTAIPALTNKYVFGDLQNGRIFYIDPDVVAGGQNALTELRLTEDGTTQRTLLQIINETAGVTATRVDLRFGQDALGNIYLMNKQDGTLRMFLPAIVPEPSTLWAAGLLTAIGLRRRRTTV
ncbi:MAG TPA: PQQ-dependent sugar dehydrogenase [Tepidisphaeraceae bacterium]|jgi:glucose/arabinose dehydrogenase